jgi:hypothetical protein
MSFQFLIPAPALKVADVASYKVALALWQETVAEMVRLYPHLVQGIALPPSPLPSPLPLVAGGEKGEWEILALEKLKAQDVRDGKRPRKSIRFTPRIALKFQNKEDYCQAIFEGRATVEKEAEGEGEGEGEAPPNISEVDVDGLH